jgi:1-acyl-sn-glycerol-3-phosphate acyltransferase
MGFLTTCRRGVRVSEHLLTGGAIALALSTGHRFGWRPVWLPAVVRWWHRRLCRALELKVRVTGELAERALLVANHISWLDIPVLGAQGQIGFLSKAEVRDWPLIGWMAETAGTLFIARGGNQAGELVQQIADHIRSKGRLAIFPEGTTTDGTSIKRFHPRLFGAAGQQEAWIQPVALRYGCNGVPDPVAPFVGDDDLVSHLLRLLRRPGLEVQLALLPPVQAGDLDRRRVAERCRAMISDALEVDLTASSTSAPAALQRSGSLLAPEGSLGQAT